MNFDGLTSQLDAIKDFKIFGKIKSIAGNKIEIIGCKNFVVIGSQCKIYAGDKVIEAEIVGLQGEVANAIPLGDINGIGLDHKVEIITKPLAIKPDLSWRGRILNYCGEPIDDKGLLKLGNESYLLNNSPPISSKRRKVAGKMDLGIKSMNLFTTFCYGQRMGIFAGSGVGKSVLMSMITKYAEADIKVIGLIGERGREVKEFVEDYLGAEGLKNAILVVATSDQSPIARRRAAYLTITIAEYFRDQNKEVMCMIDSITRFAMAQREIGLANGEPPTTKGYPPTVFSELPKLLERAGPGTAEQGNISGLFTVLVEGDDTNEPIADTVRGILDGHVIMDRKIAEAGRFPAVNILKSISRTMPGCNNDKENELINKARKYLAEYDNMADMIKIGAYKQGSNYDVDLAIKYFAPLNDFLKQIPREQVHLNECYAQLEKILSK